MESGDIVKTHLPTEPSHGSVPEGTTLYSYATTEKVKMQGTWTGLSELTCSWWAPRGPWSTKAIHDLGITHIFLGVLHVFPQVVLLDMHSNGGNYLGFFGIMFIAIGVSCITINEKKINSCHVTILMLMNIVAIVLSSVILGFGETYIRKEKRGCSRHNNCDGRIALHGLMMAFSCLELIVALVSIGLVLRSLKVRCGSTVTLHKTYLIQLPGKETSPVTMPVRNNAPSDMQSLTANEDAGFTGKKALPYSRLDETQEV